GTHGGCADGHHAPALVFRRVNGPRGFWRNLVRLTMQLVVLDFFHAHGLKSTQTDMQGYLGNFDSASANALKNFGGKVQTGRRRRHRSARLCIDRLVAIPIRWLVLAVDVGRQWDVPNALNAGGKIGNWSKADRPFAKGSTGDDFRLQFDLAGGARIA